MQPEQVVPTTTGGTAVAKKTPPAAPPTTPLPDPTFRAIYLALVQGRALNSSFPVTAGKARELLGEAQILLDELVKHEKKKV